jgi:hypothetical protein
LRWIHGKWAVVAGIAEAVAIGIGLRWIRNREAVVAGVPYVIAIDVELIRVEGESAVVAGVVDAVSIRVDPRGILVDPAIAVIVDAVTDLGCTGVDARVGIVAVVRTNHVSVVVRVGLVRREGGPCGITAIIVDGVAELKCAGVNSRPSVVAIRGVGDVAGRGCTGEHRVRWIPVSIPVGIPVERRLYSFVEPTVAVVVEAVANLWSTRVDQ